MRSPLALVGAAAAALCLTLTAPASAQNAAESASGAPASEMSPAERAALRAEVRAFLLEEPELIQEAMAALEDKQEKARRDAIAKILPQVLPEVEKLVAKGERVLAQGPEDADLTVIEMADYNCPVCRAVQPEIAEFLKADPKVRHVVKALAYIGSPLPEQAIVAAGLQGDDAKVAAFHSAMMASDDLDDARVMELAGEVGLDVEKLKADISSDIVRERVKRTYGLARALDIRGTPALIFPDRISAYATAEELAAIAAEIRAAR